jgi:4'-phosphopantetheinyl transferase
MRSSNWHTLATCSLKQNEIHVWRAYVDRECAASRRWETELVPDELTRAARFVFPLDRDRFIVRRAILRTIVGRYMQRLPADVRFVYDPHGKPKLRLSGSDIPIRFNVSHSQGLAVYALAYDREIGVDIEAIRTDTRGEDIAAAFFSPKELTEFRSLGQDQRHEAFFLWWTRKEAYMKALGGGLTISLDSFNVSLTPGMPDRLETADGGRWVLRSFQPGDGYAGAAHSTKTPLCFFRMQEVCLQPASPGRHRSGPYSKHCSNSGPARSPSHHVT